MFINKEKLNMKRKNIILVMLPILMAIFALQSCTKEATTPISIYKAAVPGNPTPAVAGVVPLSGTAYTLKWEGTTNTTWDVYVGTSSSPGLAKAGVTGNTYTFTTAVGGHFYWYVETVDVNKVRSTSPTWNFYINSAPAVPSLTAPANNAVKFSATGALTWAAPVDAEGDALTYDMYFGTTATPAIVAANLTAATYSPTMAYNTTYYWKVVAKDGHGGTNTSVVYSFTTDVFKPDYAVFNGTASELAPSISASALNNVVVQRLGTTNVIALTLPLANAMVAAGWGTVYTGTHSILITYDPVALTVTGVKQAWLDSFIDPVEMGPMSLTVVSGTIDAVAKKIVIKWKVSGNAYWGSDYTMANSTYTMK